MIYYFGSKISENLSETPEGFLIARNVPIARTGEQTYLARELGLTDGDPDRPVTVYREEKDVFDPAAMASFEGKDVTDGHPAEGVDPANHANYSKGHLQNVRREGEHLTADLFIKDPTLISEVKNGVKREVSCGYLCEYSPYLEGYKQTNIRGNHVAVVPRGRAGHEIAIKDSAPEARKGAHKMSATKALLEFFGLAAKDASPEELAKLTEDTAKVLDAEPVNKTPDAKPAEDAKSKDEDIPKGDDLGTKLDKLIERIDTIEKRLNGHGGPAEDKKTSDETAIDAELTKLTGEDPEKKEDKPSDVIEDKAGCGDACTGAAKDAAVALLKAMRPVVAGIKDPATKAAVTDALIETVRGKSLIGDIQKAAAGAAKSAADAASKTNYQKTCEDQQSAYNARNPHTAKKEG